MKKVCCIGVVGCPNIIGDYQISTFNIQKYFSRKSKMNINDLIFKGLNGYKVLSLLKTAEGVDRLYREKNMEYMECINDFIKNYSNFDIIIMFNNNFIHPEILNQYFNNTVKILGIVDSPVSCYVRDIPYLWAFDGVVYISPGYDENYSMKEALNNWGSYNNYWLPLSTPFDKIAWKDIENEQKDIDVIYIGKSYGHKIERLRRVKEYFKERFSVYGRWPLKGYMGFFRFLVGKPNFPYLVKSISDDQRCDLYKKTKIGINMHFSDSRSETGNMRMYEVCAHGVMLLCDKSGKNTHEDIFKDGVEAVYYDDISDALEKAEYYLLHDEERRRIAKAGYEKFWKEYEFYRNFEDFLNWSNDIKK